MQARFSSRTAAALVAAGLASLLALGLGAPAAAAQATATASGPGTFISVGGGVSAFQADYGQRVLGGGAAWMDLVPYGRYGFEGEARFLRFNSTENVTESTYLVGPRVSMLRPRWGLVPYGKFLVGAGRATLAFGYAQGTFFTMVPGGGVDVPLSDRWTLRAVDVEYQRWSNFGTYGELHPYGVSAGISFRLNGVDRYPKSRRSVRKSKKQDLSIQ